MHYTPREASEVQGSPQFNCTRNFTPRLTCPRLFSLSLSPRLRKKRVREIMDATMYANRVYVYARETMMIMYASQILTFLATPAICI